jgi:hypothetical protein
VELKDFVKQALTEIVLAVREAAKEANTQPDGAVISPRLAGGDVGNKTLQVAHEDGLGAAFPVEFDLAVTVTEAAELKAGMGGKAGIISMLTVKGDASGTTADTRTAVQRIKFTVPVKYPQKSQSRSNRSGRAATDYDPFS